MGLHLDEIRAARQRIKDVVINTPLIKSQVLSDYHGFEVYLKLENLQNTGAFKIRGCFNRLRKMPGDTAGIVVASSGSHGIASALAAHTLGIPATIVLPLSSPEMKRNRVKAYGAQLVVNGETYDDAREHALHIAETEGKTYVSGFDDIDVIRGQGTIVLEIAEALDGFDLLAVPVGGGGLYAGALLAAHELLPNVRVWGVESSGAPSMANSLQSGRLQTLSAIDTIADAIAVKSPGQLNFEIADKLNAGITTVHDEAIIESLGRLVMWAKVLAEPAAAATLAVDWPSVLGKTPKRAVFVISGGNVSAEMLKSAIDSVEEWPFQM